MMTRLFIVLLGLSLGNNLNNSISIRAAIQKHWEGITHIYTAFEQMNPDGTKWVGRLWLNRQKSSLYIECFNQSQQKVQTIQTSCGIIKVDNHLDQTESTIDIDQTPAGLLLNKKINWSLYPLTDVKKANHHYPASLIINNVQVTLMFEPLWGMKGLGTLTGWELLCDGEKTKIVFIKDTLRLNDPVLF